MIICIARLFTSICYIVLELNPSLVRPACLMLVYKYNDEIFIIKSVWQKNSYYREAIGIIIMCRVTNFKKSAKKKCLSVHLLNRFAKKLFHIVFGFDTVKYCLYLSHRLKLCLDK